jgi:C-3',4' desaturase CrtD
MFPEKSEPSLSPQVIVVGGGIGGLCAAALLQAAGRQVLLLEARDYVGGCAATFHHGGRASEAGATWLTGLQAGFPLARIFRTLGVETHSLAIPEADPMACVFRGRRVRRYADPERWNDALAEAYGCDNVSFWRGVHADAGAQWERAQRFHCVPPQNPGDLWAAMRSLRPRDAALLGALRSTASRIHAAGLDALRPMLDAQLMITTQGVAEEVPWLYGAPGLDFAALPAWRMPGGIGGIARTLAARFVRLGGELHCGVPVDRIARETNGWGVRSGGVTYSAQQVIVNLTHGTAAQLCDDAPAAFFRQRARQHPTPCGAFDIHFLQADQFQADGPRFFQVALDEPLPFVGSTSFFVTVSGAGDAALSPHGQRSVNISTHAPVEHWWKLDDAQYRREKDSLTERILQQLELALPDFFTGRRSEMHSGTPRTFAKFVGRDKGTVGGYPLTYANLPWRAAGPRTPFQGLWQVGDHVFPGQSIAGTALGAIYLVEKMTGTLVSA